MGLKLICQGMWATQYCAIWFSERGVTGSQRPCNSCWHLFFVGIGENNLTSQSRINTTITNQYHPPSQPSASLLAQLGIGGRRRSKIIKRSGGDFCHSEGRRDRWEDQGRKKQKDEEGAYWLVLFSTHCFQPRIFSSFSTNKPSSIMSGIRRVPAQDVPYNLILWYVSKTIYLL